MQSPLGSKIAPGWEPLHGKLCSFFCPEPVPGPVALRGNTMLWTFESNMTSAHLRCPIQICLHMFKQYSYCVMSICCVQGRVRGWGWVKAQAGASDSQELKDCTRKTKRSSLSSQRVQLNGIFTGLLGNRCALPVLGWADGENCGGVLGIPQR